MAGILKKVLPRKIYKLLVDNYYSNFNGYSKKTFSQEGEDMILKRIFEGQKHGFYVDVGAHHPKRFSNTFKFYLKGWRGINVDCNPNSMELFNSQRPRDINLEYAISDKFEIIDYYRFDESATNSFNIDFSNKNILFQSIKLSTVTLDYILGRYLPGNIEIDFLSVDVEGMDLKVLKSAGLHYYRPKIILAEDLNNYLEYEGDSPILQFMKSIDYVLFAKTVNTFIFRERSFKPFRA